MFRSRALVVLATAAVVGLLWAGKVLFVTFFFALFLSFALQPFVGLLERIRFPRTLAVFVVDPPPDGSRRLLRRERPRPGRGVLARPAVLRDARSAPSRRRRRASSRGSRSGRARSCPEGDRSVRSVRLEADAFDSLSRVAIQVKTVLSLLLYAAAVPMLSFFMLKDREKYGGAVAKILRLKGGRAAQDFAEGRRARPLGVRPRRALRRPHHGLRHDGGAPRPARPVRLRPRAAGGRLRPDPVRRRHHVDDARVPDRDPRLERRRAAREGPRLLLGRPVPRGERPDALHRRQPRAPPPARGPLRVPVLGHPLGHPGRDPRRPAHGDDQGRRGALRALRAVGRAPRRADAGPRAAGRAGSCWRI